MRYEHTVGAGTEGQPETDKTIIGLCQLDGMKHCVMLNPYSAFVEVATKDKENVLAMDSPSTVYAEYGEGN
jgi:hypothetical protein